MNRIIKSFFVCYLILKAVLVSAVISEGDAYEALRDFDVGFWNKQLSPYGGVGYWGSDVTKSVTEHLVPLREREAFKIVSATTEGEKAQYLEFQKFNTPLDFSKVNLGEAIFNLYRILQCKVDCQDEEYKTKAKKKISGITFTDTNYALNKKGEIIDPFFASIIIGGKNYHLHLDYDGGVKIKHQPGNCCLMQKGDDMPQPWCRPKSDEEPDITVYNSTLNDEEHHVLQNLLLCLEVSRRRVIDLNRPLKMGTENEPQQQIWGFEDKFCDLPVLGAIVIGLELMNDEIISRDDFFVKGRKYCCFSNRKSKAEERMEHINNLLQTFCQYKNFQTVEQFLETMEGLYKRFICRKVTERVLDSSLDKHPELSGFEPERKRRRVEENGKVERFFHIREKVMMYDELGRKNKYPNLHIVDVTDDDNDFFYAILQALQPNIRYVDVEQGDGNWQVAEILRKLLCATSDGRRKIYFPFEVAAWKFLEDKLNREVIVIDATNFDDNCVKHVDKSAWFLHCVSGNYQQAIILLWRGDRWQAVLPNSKD